jgi:hypothetical protein
VDTYDFWIFRGKLIEERSGTIRRAIVDGNDPFDVVWYAQNDFLDMVLYIKAGDNYSERGLHGNRIRWLAE